MARWVLGVVIALSMLAGYAAATDAPYYRVTGGPLIRVGNASWSVATVRVRQSSWLDWALSGGRLARAGGQPDSAQADAMNVSETTAVVVAAQVAAGRVPVGTAGLQVMPAAVAQAGAGLAPGDILLAADGTPLRTADDLRPRLLVVPRGADGSWGRAEVRTVAAARQLPVTTSVQAVAYPLGAVEGPSAGLMLALARIDALTGGGLTGGRRIAGTGALGPDGRVTSVGEVAQKVAAARSAGMDVFFVPVYQRATAAQAARGDRPRIVPVGSVTEAVRWLCTNGGHAPIC